MPSKYLTKIVGFRHFKGLSVSLSSFFQRMRTIPDVKGLVAKQWKLKLILCGGLFWPEYLQQLNTAPANKQFEMLEQTPDEHKACN